MKADVIQTCIELFQEKDPDMDFQWMLTAYVSKEKAKRKSLGTDQEANRVLQGDKIRVEGEASLTSRVVEDKENAFEADLKSCYKACLFVVLRTYNSCCAFILCLYFR